jgi:hypothetical protein
MTKLFLAYTTKKFTVGTEIFQNTLMNDVKITGKDGAQYYRTTMAMGESFFVRGRILANKAGNQTLGFFARYDNYDPTGNLSSIVNNANTKSYTAATPNYEPTTKEQFVTFGLDFTPIKNVHIMPNIWMNTYNSGVTAGDKNSAGTVFNTSMNSNISNVKGTDAVYRITFFYTYGK